MDNPLIVTLKLDELKSIINECVESAIAKNLAPPPDESLLCRKDIARFLNVSLVTISAWTKSGKLPYYQIGSRIYFKKAEVMKIFETKSK